MCGRYTLGIRGPVEFDARFGGRVDIRALSRYNVAPTEAVPAIHVDGAGQRQTVNAYWGLLPPWATSRRERVKPINARIETLTSKPMFAPLIADATHRVLLPADGWYEWMRREDPSAGGGSRVPFLHTVDGGEPFAFAGLARTTRLRDEAVGNDPAGRPYGGPGVAADRLLSVTVITCAANATASRLHDRMPVVLRDPDAEAAWLSPEFAAHEAVQLCVALDDERLTVAPASPLVNSVRSPDGPWLLDPAVTEPPSGADGGTDPQTRLDLGGSDA